MKYFIADTHFGDKSIIQIENRPFKDVDEMNECLIANWNMKVSSDDTIYVLGDFLGASEIENDELMRILMSLNGNKIFVLGNHDRCISSILRNDNYIVSSYPIIIDDFWILSHEPVYLNASMPYANIFGHVHSNPIYRTVSAQSFCVSVERIDYAPISFNEIEQRMKRS